MLIGGDAFVANGLHKCRIFPKSDFLLLLFCVPLCTVMKWSSPRALRWSGGDFAAHEVTETEAQVQRKRSTHHNDAGQVTRQKVERTSEALLCRTATKKQTLGALYVTPHAAKSLHVTSRAAVSLPDQRKSSERTLS